MKEPFLRAVKVRNNPFAQGGLRNVYGMKEYIALDKPHLLKKLRDDNSTHDAEGGPTLLVAKESRHEVPYAERLMFHLETAACQKRAMELANVWNEMVKSQGESLKNLTGADLCGTDKHVIYNSCRTDNS